MSSTPEKQVSSAKSLLRRLAARSDQQVRDWRRTLGMFTGDEIMWNICQNALAYREEDRRRTRDQNASEESELP